MAKASSTNKSSSKKLKSSYTNTRGQRISNYSDGSKKVSGSITNTAKIGDTVNGKRVTTLVGGRAYASSKDTPGYYDTRDGKNVGMSAGKDIYGNVITPEKLQTVPTPNIPTYTPTDPGNVVGAMNNGLASASNGLLSVDAKGQLAVSQNDPEKTTFQQMLDAQLGAYNEMGNGEDRMAKLEREAKLKQKREAVNSYSSQLNSIVAKSQADQLSLEGQGRGVTDVIIGGQQAQINREAAIKALPIQAQLAAAQADLSMAQEHVDKMFQLQSQDALSKYQFKSKLIDSVFQYANAEQQRALEERRIAESRTYDMQKMNMSTAQDFANQAFANGQSSLGSRIMALDPTSPTYRQDVARLGAQLVKPSSGAGKRDTQVVDGKLIDMQTGEVISEIGGASTQKTTQLNEALTLARELRLDDAVGKKSAVGASFAKLIPDALGKNRGLQPSRAAFEAKVETLKSNLTLDNLKLLKGAMSDKDLAFLQAIGSSLDTNMSEKQFNGELDRVITKLEGATPVESGTAITKKGLPFNVDAAKQAGYTDAEIRAYLNSH